MARSSVWSGWINLAGLLIVVVGVVNGLQGLIAIIRGSYFGLSPNQIIVFDVKTWGWITLIWGIVLVVAGVALLAGAAWARSLGIVLGCLNFVVQLAFLGSSQYTLSTLAALGLTVVVLYALIVRWDDRPMPPSGGQR
jgi:hypothetical protein